MSGKVMVLKNGESDYEMTWEKQLCHQINKQHKASNSDSGPNGVFFLFWFDFYFLFLENLP